MGVPKIAVFVPDNEDEMYFFRRMATELPPLLADQASVFISVAHAHTQEVLDLLDGYNWPTPKMLLSRMLDFNEDGTSSGTKLFYNPSGLIEYEFDRNGLAELDAAIVKATKKEEEARTQLKALKKKRREQSRRKKKKKSSKKAKEKRSWREELEL